jgi:ribosome biogenesis protein Nip4
MGKGRGAYTVLMKKHEGRNPLGKPRRRRKNNIKTDLEEVGCGKLDWFDVAQYRDRWLDVVNAEMNLRFP